MQKFFLTAAQHGTPGSIRSGKLFTACIAASLLSLAGAAGAQAKLAGSAPVTYDNKYQIYGGLNLQTFQAGQNLPYRMNLGGVEVMGTYWLTSKLGVAAEFRGGAGTTPVFPSIYKGRQLVYLADGLGGVEYRGPKNQKAALGLHALAGISHGVFDTTSRDLPVDVGLYKNSNSPVGVAGGSVDFNVTKNIALRLSPDIWFEHFGTETREFFAISGGVVYRFGKR